MIRAAIDLLKWFGATLDAALANSIEVSGWCPKGGWAEDMKRPPGVDVGLFEVLVAAFLCFHVVLDRATDLTLAGAFHMSRQLTIGSIYSGREVFRIG